MTVETPEMLHPDDTLARTLDPAERTPCERWTRVMGYHRPVSAFNRGKQSEHAERRLFTEAATRGATHG